MKETIKHLFPIVISALGAFFAILIFFTGIFEYNHGISLTQKDNQTDIAMKMDALPTSAMPTIKYAGGVLTVGESNHFHQLFQLKYPNETITDINSDEEVQLYLVKVENMNENNVLTKLHSVDVTSIEEIPSAAIYDIEEKILFFHKSGIYKVFVRMYFKNQSGILYEFNLPVEVG